MPLRTKPAADLVDCAVSPPCLIATATPRELLPIARAPRAYAPDATAPAEWDFRWSSGASIRRLDSATLACVHESGGARGGRGEDRRRARVASIGAVGLSLVPLLVATASSGPTGFARAHLVAYAQHATRPAEWRFCWPSIARTPWARPLVPARGEARVPRPRMCADEGRPRGSVPVRLRRGACGGTRRLGSGRPSA